MTNQIYDIIIVGASAEGIALAEYLAAKTSEAKIALVSSHFKNVPEKKDLSKINLIEQEVTFISYFRGLHSFTLANKQAIFSKTTVIATGSKPIKSAFKGKGIYYNTQEFKKPEKFLKQVVVSGHDRKAADYAVYLSKKFKYVYLCSPTLELTCDKKIIHKLATIANVVHLPGCNIISCKHSKEGTLTEVTLDTYSTINCAALVFSLGRVPDIPPIQKQMLELTEKGSLKVKVFNELTTVPNIFAIGECSSHNTKNSIIIVGKNIIERNNLK